MERRERERSISLMFLLDQSTGSCLQLLQLLAVALPSKPWLRTNGVSTNGAAAKLNNFDRLGKEVPAVKQKHEM